MPLTDYDPTEIVPVMRQHLQEILAALNWCHGYFSAHDLADGYRQGKQTPAPSPITRRIAQAYNHAEGYVHDDVSPQ